MARPHSKIREGERRDELVMIVANTRVLPAIDIHTNGTFRTQLTTRRSFVSVMFSLPVDSLFHRHLQFCCKVQ